MKKKDIDKFLQKNSGYGYYYNDCNVLEKALSMERNYILNCSDSKKDFSVEGRNKRFKMYLKRAKKECKYGR